MICACGRIQIPRDEKVVMRHERFERTHQFQKWNKKIIKMEDIINNDIEYTSLSDSEIKGLIMLKGTNKKMSLLLTHVDN